MAKSISEINQKLKQLNKKYKETGLTDASISKKAAASIQGNKNAKNGLLKKISKLGASKGGKTNVLSGHMHKLNSISSKKRSERRKKQIEKEDVIKVLQKYPFNKDRAIALNITQVTLRRILKEYKLYKKETAGEKMMKVYSAEERSKILNKHKNKK